MIRRCREAQSRGQQPHLSLQEAPGCPPGLFSPSVELIGSSTSSKFLLICREKKHLHCLESENTFRIKGTKTKCIAWERTLSSKQSGQELQSPGLCQ